MELERGTVLLPHVHKANCGLPRAVDFVVALVGLALASPIIAIAAVVIFLSSGAPIFFRQKRVGAHGVEFTMYKLRSMTYVGDSLGVTAGDDARVTAVGHVLRKTKLDELPELWNVLRGDMALVGPRPEVPQYVDMANPAWQGALQVKPGLTDPVTLRLLDEQQLLTRVKGGQRERLYLTALLPWKLSEYVAYLNRRTWRTDWAVIWNTLLTAVRLRKIAPPDIAEVLKFAGYDEQQQLAALIEPDGNRAISMPVLPVLRRQYHIIYDALVFLASFVVAYLLRFEFVIPDKEAFNMLHQIPWVMTLQLAAMCVAGSYGVVWRYIGMHDIGRFLVAAAWATAPLTILRMIGGTQPIAHVPISVIVIDAILGFGGVVGVRVLRRSIYECLETRKTIAISGLERKRVLLIGAGQAGRTVLGEMRRKQPGRVPVGFVDDDAWKQGMSIDGVRVLGTADDVPKLVSELRIDHIIISIAHATRTEFRRILQICDGVPAKVQVIPSVSEILLDKVKITRIRDLQYEDLLGRPPVNLFESGVESFIQGNVVMVTGAGGSIGSELARQVMHAKPKQLLMIERAEPALFRIYRSLTEGTGAENVIPLACDVCSTARMRQVFAAYRPDIVIHAAAHKHVPLMEANVVEAVANNTLGTRDLAEIAGEFGAGVFVLISTDKAVRPTSVMGASKRAAEIAVQQLQSRFATRYVAVRFGNVIGSAGSVIQIFQEQIRAGGPVTVTDPAMKRYFMTITEASQLVLSAASMGEGGEIFVLDMGEPVPILDVAKDVITLSGLRPFEDIDIVFTGMRPGEKLFEEIELDGEHVSKTRHPKIFIGKFAGPSGESVVRAIQNMRALVERGSTDQVVAALCDLVAEAELRRMQPPHPEGIGLARHAVAMS